MATFNGEQYLPEQLESISRQEGVRWSLTAADDGSTDRTVWILEEFQKQHPEKVDVLAGPQSGSASANFFHLLRKAPPSDYYAFCDQDDVWLPNKLRVLLASCIEGEAGLDAPSLAYSDLRVVDEDLRCIAPSFMTEIAAVPDEVTFGSCLMENAIPGCAMVFNHALRNVFLEYEGDLSDARMHDWWMALIALATGSVTYAPEILTLYRQHSNNAAGSVRRRGVRFAYEKLRKSGSVEADANARQAALLVRAHGLRLPAGPHAQAQAVSTFTILNKYQRVSACIRLGILKQGNARRAYQLIKI